MGAKNEIFSPAAPNWGVFPPIMGGEHPKKVFPPHDGGSKKRHIFLAPPIVGGEQKKCTPRFWEMRKYSPLILK